MVSVRLAFLFLAVLIGPLMGAAACAKTIARIEIRGNQRIVRDAIVPHIRSKGGQPLIQRQVNDDIRSIYEMGFFSAVSAVVESTQDPDRIFLVIVIRERPLITDVVWKGMTVMSPTDKALSHLVEVRPGDIEDTVGLQETMNHITQLYQERGYLQAQVLYDPVRDRDNTIVAQFDVIEGRKAPAR
jgi:outer membrane protein insertion porin family